MATGVGVCPDAAARVGSTHSTAPSWKNSFFQIGTRRFTSSIDEPARLEGLLAVRPADRDGHRGVSDLELPDPVLQGDAHRPPRLGLRHDPGALLLRHRAIGRVLQPAHAAAVMVVAHQPEKRGDPTVRGVLDPARERRRIDGTRSQEAEHQPPASGGRIASSAPSASARVEIGVGEVHRAERARRDLLATGQRSEMIEGIPNRRGDGQGDPNVFQAKTFRVAGEEEHADVHDLGGRGRHAWKLTAPASGGTAKTASPRGDAT